MPRCPYSSHRNFRLRCKHLYHLPFTPCPPPHPKLGIRPFDFVRFRLTKNSIAATIVLVISFQCHSLFALPDDNNQPLELTANTADIDQQKKHGEFTGNVALDQGTTHLRATRAITHTNDKNQLISAIIYGNPNLPEGNPDRLVHYWTQPTSDKPLMHAYADVIHYYPEQHLIKLLGHARVEQGKDSIAAERIFYDTQNQHVTTENDDNTRTLIIFHPEKKS